MLAPSSPRSQLLQTQGMMNAYLLEGFVWSFKQCTSASSGPQLSAKEKRCIQQGFQAFVDARTAIGATVQQQTQQQGDF